MAKKSEFRTDGMVVSRTFEFVGEDGRTHRQVLRAATHHRHSPWSDCATCLEKHHVARKARVKREKAARRRNRVSAR